MTTITEVKLPLVVQHSSRKLTLRRWRQGDQKALIKHADNKNVSLWMRDFFPYPYTSADADFWINLHDPIKKEEGAAADAKFSSSGSSGSELHPSSPEAQMGSGSAAQGPAQHLAICIDDSPVGSIGLNTMGDIQRFTVEVGYWLGEGVWGYGIMTSVLPAFMAYLWAAFPAVHRVEASIFAQNAGSGRVLEKCGFRFEGRHIGAYFKRDEFHDALMYACIRAKKGGAGGAGSSDGVGAKADEGKADSRGPGVGCESGKEKAAGSA